MEEIYPKDWKEYKFGDVFDLGGSLSISRANLSDEGICYLHYGDIHKSNNSFIDVSKSYKEIPKYNVALEEVDSKYLLKDGDIVFADASEDYEGIAKSLIVVNTDNKPFISGLHTIVARDKGDLVDNTYKRYFLKDWKIRKQLMTLATGTSVLGISQPNLKKTKVFLPPKEEQHKIGLILSKWDKAIELKEKLIKQKKEQKKGLSQKLLTGETRLDGFKEPWKKAKLGSVATIVMGQSPKSDSYNELKEGFPLIQGNADIKNRRTLPRTWTTNPTKICHPNDILMTVRAPVGSIALSEHEACLGRGVCAIKANINSDYLYYQLIRRENMWGKMAQGSTFESINSNDIKDLIIEVPTEKEQIAIAKILKIADKQLYLLKKELENLNSQKQAFMQQLLTGKIRVKV